MRYLSVCAGIEAASVAWHDLGWTPVAFSEIEAFPSAVLKHHYPDVPNWGDMTQFKEWPDANIDVLVGGTPCQSFSVAGLRKGLADPRGNLMLTFLAIADRYRPEWLVWENVPGVLSSNGGKDFGALLGGLAELGYGFAYRILDAQYFGVAQRRRRVFVVANLRDWRRAAAVLFERESLSGNPAPRREARQDVAGTIAARFGISRNNHEECVPDVSNAICARDYKKPRPKADQGALVVVQPITFGAQMSVPQTDVDMVQTLQAKNPMAVAFGGDVAQSLTARHDSSPCADRGMDVVAVAQPVFGIDAEQNAHEELMGTLRSHHSGGYEGAKVAQPVAMRESGSGFWMQDAVAGTLRAEGENRPSRPSHVIQQHAMQVRRLTPRECERLQGFPDDYTLIPYRNKPAADGPRYKALGNSMAVPVMRWIGNRIQQVHDITKETK